MVEVVLLKIKWKELIICIIIPLAVGGLSAVISGNAMAEFGNLKQPPLSPPAVLFPIVWTVLYILMGIASYLVLTSESDKKLKQVSLTIYGIQLAFNFLWSIIFFNFEQYLFAFIWLVALWILILTCIILFSKSSKAAAYLMIPYLLWVSFAGYLNFAIYLLNAK